MLTLHVTFKAHTHTTRLSLATIVYQVLETRVRQVFRLWTTPLLLCYRDAQAHNIIIIDDGDVAAMLGGLSPGQKSLCLEVFARSAALAELKNIHLIRRCFVKELKRKCARKDKVARRHLRSELAGIRHGLTKAGISKGVVARMVSKIGLEVRLFFAERFFDAERVQPMRQNWRQSAEAGPGHSEQTHEARRERVYKKTRKRPWKPFSLSASTISGPRSVSCPSLFSEKGSNNSDEPEQMSATNPSSAFALGGAESEEEEPFQRSDVWLSSPHMEGSGRSCGACGRPLAVRRISFRCTDCWWFEVCGGCARAGVGSPEHILNPFFEADGRERALYQANEILSRLSARQKESGWLAFKQLLDRTSKRRN